MKNKEFKRSLILEDIPKKYYKDKMRLKKSCKNNWSEVKDILKDSYGEETYTALEQLSKARYEASKKIMDHVRFWISQGWDIYFATWTYSDDLYPNIPIDILKRRVYKVTSQFLDFITNIDFGEKKHRLHFHSLIAVSPDCPYKFVSKKEYLERLDHPDSKKIKGKYYIIEGNKLLENYEKKTGYYLLQKVSINDKDVTKVSNYLAKLASHSLKVKQARVGVKTNTDYQKHKQAMDKLTKLKNLDEDPIRIDTRDLKNFHKDLYETLYETDLDKELCNLAREKIEMAEFEKQKSIEQWEKGDGRPIESDIWKGLPEWFERHNTIQLIACLISKLRP